MKQRDFLKFIAIAGGSALAFPYIPKSIKTPDRGIWSREGDGLWIYRKPQMASVILSRTLGDGEDKKAVLSNSGFARPLPSSLGSWNKLRIAVRSAWTPVTGASINSTPRYAVGLCSGSAQTFLSQTCTNFIGGCTNGATLTYGYTNKGWSAAAFAATKVAGVLTAGSTLGLHVHQSTENGTVDGRTLQFIDITKGSPSFTVGGFRHADAFGAPYSQATFLSLATLSNAASGSYFVAATDVTIAFSESNGTLTHVNLAWDRTLPTIEISDLAIVRLT